MSLATLQTAAVDWASAQDVWCRREFVVQALSCLLIELFFLVARFACEPRTSSR